MKISNAPWYWRQARATRDESAPKHGIAKSARVDLGLELLMLARRPDQTFTRHDIAAWAGCTDAGIYQIEKAALRKLANAVRFGKLRREAAELLDQLGSGRAA